MMRRMPVIASLCFVLLIVSGCTGEAGTTQPDPTTAIKAEPQSDIPVYTFWELVEDSDVIARVAIISQAEEVKSEFVEHRDTEGGELHEHYIPLLVMNAEVTDVLKGDTALEGEVITVKQLTSEEPLTEPHIYVTFLAFSEEEDAYYSKGENQHVKIADGRLVSNIVEMEGEYPVEEFIRAIREQLDKN